MSEQSLNGTSRDEVTATILGAIRDANELRAADAKIADAATAPLFGGEGPLDSLSLVSLLMDIEEGLLDFDLEVSLSSEHAMSQAKSPYRSVDSLVDYIMEQAS